MTQKEQDLDIVLADLISKGMEDLLLEERPMPVIRAQLNAWWKSLSTETQDDYRLRLRVKIERIRQASEAMTQELQAASSHRA